MKYMPIVDIQKLASIAAPVLTPLGPAAVLIQGLHDGLVKSGMDTNFAWVPSSSSGIGMELTGFLASKMTVRALKGNDWTSFLLAICGIVGYIIFAVMGIQYVPNAEMFQAFVGMSTIAYFAYGVYEYMQNKDARTLQALEVTTKAQEVELERKERENRMEIERIQAEANAKAREAEAQRMLTNAQTRQIKAGKPVSSVSKGVQPSSVHGGQFQADPAKIKEIQDYWKNNLATNPSLSARQVAKACQCSPTTAGKYKP